MRSICAIIMLFLLYHKCNGEADDYRQEAAKVLYSNPKYVKDTTIFTFRHTRKSPYLTTANCTTLHVWEDNVTVVIDFFNARTKEEIIKLDFKVCDIIKVPWAKVWLKQYTNVPSHCPLLPNTFIFKEVEIPPKNFPIPLPTGDYKVGVCFIITSTKEKILDFKMNLRFVGKKFGV